MKNWKALMLKSMALFTLAVLANAGETLYNGIELPDEWPPKYVKITREPMPVPYLKNPPAAIVIDVGRQLFVDDFLIEKTTMKRTFHKPEYHPANPVLKPDKPWEHKSVGWFAAPFSGGAWYDPADELYKMWYTGGFLASTCYATSKDGINWEKPKLDVQEGTNIVLEPVAEGRRRVDTTTVWLDQNTKDPSERFKYFATEATEGWGLTYRTSADGIHWSKPEAKVEIWGDRTTAFYNPFRKVWVLSQRTETAKGERARSYLEETTAGEMMAKVTFNEIDELGGESVHWTGADDLDPRHTDPKYEDIEPQLYNLDAAPYESVMVSYYSIWQGPENHICGELGLQKRNDILIGFSRDYQLHLGRKELALW
ncbi:MAG: hypothetical protein ACYS5F_01395 [Planctomycetota bacterium]